MLFRRLVTTAAKKATTVTVYSSKNCGLCVEAKEVISKVQEKIPFTLIEEDIYSKGNEKWRQIYKYDIPVSTS